MKLLLALTIASPYFSSANDATFNAMGNTLIPLQETTVQLKKEVLNLTRKKDWMEVSVYFEFYNPGNEKELTVGFVAPPDIEEVDNNDTTHIHIRDFLAIVNGDTLNYRLKKLSMSGFKIADSLIGYQDFVYYFKCTFPKGKTIIKHNYSYQGGGGVDVKKDYYYRLSSGTKWANREIEDFEINIDMGKDVYFSLPYAFGGVPSDWKIIGNGRKSHTQMSLPYWERNQVSMVYMREGIVQLKRKHFKPRNDLSIIEFTSEYEFYLWTNYKEENDFFVLQEFFEEYSGEYKEKIKTISDKQLRLLINLPYARAGYDFKDFELKKTFSKYIWYMPDPNVKSEFKYYYFSHDLLDELTIEVKRRKMNNRR